MNGYDIGLVGDSLAHTKTTQLRTQDSDSAVHTNLPHLCTQTGR